MKSLRKLWLKLFPKYRRLEHRFVSYSTAGRLIRDTAHLAQSEQWNVAPEELHNQVRGWVHLERRERIT